MWLSATFRGHRISAITFLEVCEVQIVVLSSVSEVFTLSVLLILPSAASCVVLRFVVFCIEPEPVITWCTGELCLSYIVKHL